MNKGYQPPRVVQAASVCVERSFLDASLSPMTVESVGQEVEEKDFSSGDFNFEWE